MHRNRSRKCGRRNDTTDTRKSTVSQINRKNRRFVLTILEGIVVTLNRVIERARRNVASILTVFSNCVLGATQTTHMHRNCIRAGGLEPSSNNGYRDLRIVKRDQNTESTIRRGYAKTKRHSVLQRFIHCPSSRLLNLLPYPVSRSSYKRVEFFPLSIYLSISPHHLSLVCTYGNRLKAYAQGLT